MEAKTVSRPRTVAVPSFREVKLPSRMRQRNKGANKDNKAGITGYDLAHPINLVQHFNYELSACKFLVVVQYRGLWSEYCQNYLQEWESLALSIREQGGNLMAVTSQAAASAMKTARSLKLSYQCIGDPGHALRDYWKDQRYVTASLTSEDSPYYHKYHPNVRRYRFGMVQPTLLVLSRDHTVLYKWTAQPSLSNGFGVGGRPVPDEVLSFVQVRLQRHLLSKTQKPEEGDDEKPVSSQVDWVMVSDSPSLPVYSAIGYVHEYQLIVYIGLAILLLLAVMLQLYPKIR